jgi:hypothetical protein
MNIYGIDIPLNSYRQTSSPAKGIGKGFDDVLSRELSAPQKTPDIMPSDSAGTDPMAHILARGDEILTMLETYAADLENPCKTLKQMTPLVDVIEHEVDRFEKSAHTGFSSDEAFMAWVNELSLTARVATAKFHRGDFV